jgi:hypothetical protein
MRQGRKRRYPGYPTIAIVVDGETEFWYLQMLKRNERTIRVNIKPEIPSRKSIKEQYELVCDLSSREYSKVFWMVDLDVIIKETREAPRGAESAITRFIGYRADLLSNFDNVSVIVNNPCLEFWFLLHYQKTARYFDTCSAAEHQLKKHLQGYEKTQKYFTKQGNDIYLRLKPYITKAINNANALGSFNKQASQKAICEMGSFFRCRELSDYFGT